VKSIWQRLALAALLACLAATVEAGDSRIGFWDSQRAATTSCSR
jgi:hypothetical protein